MLFHPEEQIFDLSLLPSLAKVDPAFSRFITKYSRAEMVNQKEIGAQWMELVSGHVGVKYNRAGRYELLSSIKKMLMLLNKFFGVTAKNLPELGTLLST